MSKYTLVHVRTGMIPDILSVGVSRSFLYMFFASFYPDCRLLTAFYASHVCWLVLCAAMSTYSMAPTHIDQHASYHFSAAPIETKLEQVAPYFI